MGKTWIVAADTEITQAVIDAADAAGCASIAQGIPPKLAGVVDEGDLPCAYEPPERTPSPHAITHWARVAALNPGADKPLAVTRNWQGQQVSVDCYVTEDMVDLYQAGELTVGDFVLVVFVDADRTQPLATQKVFKSW